MCVNKSTIIVLPSCVVELLDCDVIKLLISFVYVHYRKTQVGNIDIVQIRPPRFIARDGAV